LRAAIAAAEAIKNVVVGGGGPAGVKAARISALRGHGAVLLEASGRLGGQLELASAGMTLRQIRGGGGLVDR